jgi:hypothetical protein
MNRQMSEAKCITQHVPLHSAPISLAPKKPVGFSLGAKKPV